MINDNSAVLKMPRDRYIQWKCNWMQQQHILGIASLMVIFWNENATFPSPEQSTSEANPTECDGKQRLQCQYYFIHLYVHD